MSGTWGMCWHDVSSMTLQFLHSTCLPNWHHVFDTKACWQSNIWVPSDHGCSSLWMIWWLSTMKCTLVKQLIRWPTWAGFPNIILFFFKWVYLFITYDVWGLVNSWHALRPSFLFTNDSTSLLSNDSSLFATTLPQPELYLSLFFAKYQAFQMYSPKILSKCLKCITHYAQKMDIWNYMWLQSR
jgi:hypothetical protein